MYKVIQICIFFCDSFPFYRLFQGIMLYSKFLLFILYMVVSLTCLENPMDGGAWWAAVHGVAKSQTRLRDFTFTFHFHALEKEMATHSRVLAWRIPGMGEPGGLPSMGSHRVRHDWSDLAAAVSLNLILPVYPFLPFPFGHHKFVFYDCECICFVNKLICTIFLDSTCKCYCVVFVFL